MVKSPLFLNYSVYVDRVVVRYRQLTEPKVVYLTRPALLKHFKGMANHAGHI